MPMMYGCSGRSFRASSMSVNSCDAALDCHEYGRWKSGIRSAGAWGPRSSSTETNSSSAVVDRHGIDRKRWGGRERSFSVIGGSIRGYRIAPKLLQESVRPCKIEVESLTVMKGSAPGSRIDRLGRCAEREESLLLRARRHRAAARPHRIHPSGTAVDPQATPKALDRLGWRTREGGSVDRWRVRDLPAATVLRNITPEQDRACRARRLVRRGPGAGAGGARAGMTASAADAEGPERHV